VGGGSARPRDPAAPCSIGLDRPPAYRPFAGVGFTFRVFFTFFIVFFWADTETKLRNKAFLVFQFFTPGVLMCVSVPSLLKTQWKDEECFLKTKE